MKKHLTRLAIIGAVVAPAVAFAQGTLEALVTFQSIVDTLGQIVKTLLPIVFALAVLAFFYGIFMYVFAHSTDGKKNGRNIMLWSLVAIFVMASLFGIIQLAQSSLGIQQGSGDLTPVGVGGL